MSRFPPSSAPQRPARGRALPSSLAAMALAVVMLGGCGTQSTPKSYTGGVRDSFLEACRGQNEDQQPRVSAPADVCTCAYDEIRKRIPFERFKEVNNDLTDKPGELPNDFRRIVDGCRTAG